jgi:4-hydroxybenzoate polyprenyltransferase
MRPKQWTKNGFVLVPLVFDGKLFDPGHVLAVGAGFLIFCLISSVVYIINDLADITADQQHPTKRNRPLPSGRLSKRVALVAAVIIPLACLPAAFALDVWFGVVVSLYLGIQLLYSYRLKHVVLIDVMTVAAGFLLRVGGGALLVDAQRFSPWLYIFTTMLALFLGFSKRRQELVLLRDDANNHRAILDHYNIRLLDEIILIVTATSVLTYALYTFSAEGLPANHAMMLTTPFVLYGIFRYLYLIHVQNEVGAPDEVFLKDRPIQIAVLLWGLAVIVVLYVMA